VSNKTPSVIIHASEHSTYWWISKFSDEIEALQKEIKDLKQLAHNPQPVYPPEKGEELEDRIEQLETK
jgi:G:T-mismatch repair DNA endonuclease (very short patch repair protein)